MKEKKNTSTNNTDKEIRDGKTYEVAQAVDYKI